MGYGIGRKVYIPENPSFDSVIAMAMREAKTISGKCCDYEIKNLAAHFPEYDQLDRLSLKIGRSTDVFGLSRWSRSQLYKLIKVPGQYMNALIYSYDPVLKNLARENINNMLKRCNKNVNLRVYGNKIRGIVSTSYSTFDVLDILKVVHELAYKYEFLGLRDMQCKGYCLNEEEFNLRLIFNDCIPGVRDKDLHLGLSIASSDVGKSAVRIESWVYREICTNGTYSLSGTERICHQRHIAVKPERIKDMIMDIMMSTPEIVERTSSRIREAEVISLIDSPLLDPGYELPAKNKRHGVREKVAAYLNLPNNAMNEVASIAVSKYEPDLWGYCSAVTEYAQSCETALTRVLLENSAGSLVVDFDRITEGFSKR